MRRRIPFALLVPCVAAAFGCTPPAGPPNIVLIYADDLGWRDLGVMGSRYYETPHIDALAGAGMRFTNAYANAPNCAPSRASLLSGQYPPRHGVYTVGSATRGDAKQRRLVPVQNKTMLDLDVVTIAEALRVSGYATGHFGKWHVGGQGALPTDQGFDVNVGGDQSGAPPTHFYPYANDQRRLPGLSGGADGEYLTDRLTDEAIAFLEQHASRPFFLYLSHYAVHTPIQGKEEDVERFRAIDGVDGHDDPTYASMIAALDDGVGRVLSTLERLALTERTIVIFLSDNGGFGPVTSMSPLRGSKGMLYEGGIRVPLIIRWPGMTDPGTVSAEPVIGTDMFPTFLELAGTSAAPGQMLDGVSLVPILQGEGAHATRPLFWHFPAYLQRDRSVQGPWRTTPVSAVRMGDYKLLHFFEHDAWELYDLSADPGEQVNLIDREPERARELQQVLRGWWDSSGAWLPSEANPSFESDAR